MYEHRPDQLPTRKVFFHRLARSTGIGLAIVAASLGIGIVGYHLTEGLGWLDSLLNASMILGGMGPVNELHSNAGKWFASFYALFSGVVFLVMCGVIFAPVVHRFLHKFHLDIQSKSK